MLLKSPKRPDMQKVPVYVISLEGARERRALIKAHLDGLKLEYELINAVEGMKLDPGYRERVNPNKNMSHGVLGCYLSHLYVYEHIIANQISVALILEDDTVLHYSVKALLENGCQNLDFDCCFLGSEDHGDEGYVFYDAGSAVELGGGFNAYVLSSGPYCNNAYLITLQGAKKRIACAFPARTAIDHYHFLPYRIIGE
jgi:glycosyl transferase family 25